MDLCSIGQGIKPPRLQGCLNTLEFLRYALIGKERSASENQENMASPRRAKIQPKEFREHTYIDCR